MSKQMRHVTADRADVRTFQVELRKIIKLVETQRSIHAEFVSADFSKFLLLEVELVLNVANEFLQHILQGDQAHCPSEFIHNDCDVGVFAKK